MHAHTHTRTSTPARSRAHTVLRVMTSVQGVCGTWRRRWTRGCGGCVPSGLGGSGTTYSHIPSGHSGLSLTLVLPHVLSFSSYISPISDTRPPPSIFSNLPLPFFCDTLNARAVRCVVGMASAKASLLKPRTLLNYNQEHLRTVIYTQCMREHTMHTTRATMSNTRQTRAVELSAMAHCTAQSLRGESTLAGRKERGEE